MTLAVLRRLGASLLFLALAAGLRAQTPDKALSGMSMDDLMNAEVTSVARHGERLSDTAAAVFVISREDIERSGATTIAEVLRIAPGLDVASVDGTIWAISARGFNGRWANKLLVMIDGRTVYSPVFSGVYWDLQDTMLEDIDRIEVIRGPGGTLWGANAVNGVINIITRNAIETPGAVVSAGGGTAERGFASARQGLAVGDNFHFRVFGKSFDRGANDLEPVGHAHDAWSGERAGFRADWIASAKDSLALEGDLYRGSADEEVGLVSASNPFGGPALANINDRGGDVLLRWTQTQSKGSETTLQAYFDSATHPSPAMLEVRHDFDVDFQHQLSVGTRHSLVWGLGYRNSDASTSSPLEIVSLAKPVVQDDLVSGFLQDEVRLPHDIRLTFGSKVQHDRSAGLQAQPTIRGLWRPSERQAVWAAVTNAVRTPSFIELDGTVNTGAFVGPGGQPVLVALTGNPDLKPERVMTYESGYRWLDGGASIDVATFYSKFKGVVDNGMQAIYSDAAGRLVLPLPFENALSGHSEGVEIFATDRLTDRIDLRAGYTWMNIAYRDNQDGQPNHTGASDTPSNQVQLRAFFTVSPAFEVDGSAYSVSRLRDTGIPAYVRFDLRLAWHATPSWEFSLVGQNLFDNRHREFIGNEGPTAGPINRSVYGKITWHSH